ncbi:MAG: phytanoyl-CoA dioxygenase family protein [Acidobacteria bacterium]|nr:phytanoyl-CoA dioxygenase family protein [Acidobacteriota bacterium]
MLDMEGSRVSEFYSRYGYFHFKPSDSLFLQNVEEGRQTFYDLLKELPQGELRTAFKNKEGKIRHLSFVHLSREIFLKLMLSEEVRALVRAVFGSQRLYVSHSKISFKEAGEDLAWHPHQDNGYRLVNRVPLRKGMTVGVFLEDADDRNGTLEVFPSSQKLKTLPHFFMKENDHDWSGQIVIKDLPKNIEPKPIIARRGDIVIFTFETIHQSRPNLSHGYRPLLLFEIEPYEGFSSDEHGNPPVIINGELSRVERTLCGLHGIPKKVRLAVGRVPLFKKWYRKLKYR